MGNLSPGRSGAGRRRQRGTRRARRCRFSRQRTLRKHAGRILWRQDRFGRKRALRKHTARLLRRRQVGFGNAFHPCRFPAVPGRKNEPVWRRRSRSRISLFPFLRSHAERRKRELCPGPVPLSGEYRCRSFPHSGDLGRHCCILFSTPCERVPERREYRCRLVFRRDGGAQSFDDFGQWSITGDSLTARGQLDCIAGTAHRRGIFRGALGVPPGNFTVLCAAIGMRRRARGDASR